MAVNKYEISLWVLKNIFMNEFNKLVKFFLHRKPQQNTKQFHLNIFLVQKAQYLSC